VHRPPRRGGGGGGASAMKPWGLTPGPPLSKQESVNAVLKLLLSI